MQRQKLTADRPKEICILTRAHDVDAPVCSDDLRADKIVYHESVLGREEAEAAAQCQTSDSCGMMGRLQLNHLFSKTLIRTSVVDSTPDSG